MGTFGSVPIRRVVVAALAALAMGCLGGGCSNRPPLLPSCAADRAAAVEQLDAISRAEQAAIARRAPVYRDRTLESRLGSVLEKLLRPLNKRPEAFRIVILSDPQPDAYSYPDGTIYMHTGLLACLENEAELALLLAHELMHVIREHALQAYQAFAAEAHRGPPPTEVAAGFGLSGWWSASMSAYRWMHQRRAFEEEADRMGLDLVVRANYDPHAALDIFNDVTHDDPAGLSAERRDALRTCVAEQGRTDSRQAAPVHGFRSDLQPLLLHQAQSDARLGRWQHALKSARRLLRGSPGQAQGHYLLAEILRQRQAPGDWEQALIHYRESIRLNPRCPKSHKAAGLLHLRQGQLDLARAYFEKALALSPSPGDAAYLANYLATLPTTPKGDIQ